MNMNMNDMDREYKAWIVCGVFKATAKRGPLGPFPMFSGLGDFLPFFRSQRAAREYCRAHNIKVPGPLGVHFRKVEVKATLARRPA